METVNLNLEIPVKYSAEICVVGAGPAGIAAAVTAARRGRKVILLDAHTMAGGMSTAAMVPCFMPFTDGVNFLPGGFGRENDVARDGIARLIFRSGKDGKRAVSRATQAPL